jgi:hypothetical protein
MLSTAIEEEVEVFNAAAELLGLGRGVERRMHGRHKYDALVLIGPYIQGNPVQESLLPVRCQDVSNGGISFISRMLEPDRLIVVQLNLNIAEPLRLIARVIRQTPVDDTGFAHLVACQFIRRPD